MYDNIRDSTIMPNAFYDKDVSGEAKSFINSILQVNPFKRLTLLEIAQHPWLD